MPFSCLREARHAATLPKYILTGALPRPGLVRPLIAVVRDAAPYRLAQPAGQRPRIPVHVLLLYRAPEPLGSDVVSTSQC